MRLLNVCLPASKCKLHVDRDCLSCLLLIPHSLAHSWHQINICKLRRQNYQLPAEEEINTLVSLPLTNPLSVEEGLPRQTQRTLELLGRVVSKPGDKGTSLYGCCFFSIQFLKWLGHGEGKIIILWATKSNLVLIVLKSWSKKFQLRTLRAKVKETYWFWWYCVILPSLLLWYSVFKFSCSPLNFYIFVFFANVLSPLYWFLETVLCGEVVPWPGWWRNLSSFKDSSF